MNELAPQYRVQASVLHGPKDLRLEERVINDPADDEVQIAITRTGLCGSDLHYYHHSANGDFHVKEPLTLGHESSGRIVKIGKAAPREKFNIGDHVALEVGVPCGTSECEYCSADRYNLCKQLRFRSSAKSSPHFQGTLQERINHPAQWVHVLPNEITLDRGALLEPLAVALHAIRRAKLASATSQFLVLGAGTIGLLVSLCLRELGHFVVIADISSERVKFAELNDFANRGVVFPLEKGESVESRLDTAKKNKELACNGLKDSFESSTDGKDVDSEVLFDGVFECTGVETCVQTAIYATKAGGKVMLVGMGQAVQTLHLASASLREIDIIGVFRYAGNYREGIEMLADEKFLHIDKLITHRFKGLEQVPSAFEMAGKAVDDEGHLVLKVMVELESTV